MQIAVGDGGVRFELRHPDRAFRVTETPSRDVPLPRRKVAIGNDVGRLSLESDVGLEHDAEQRTVLAVEIEVGRNARLRFHSEYGGLFAVGIFVGSRFERRLADRFRVDEIASQRNTRGAFADGDRLTVDIGAPEDAAGESRRAALDPVPRTRRAKEQFTPVFYLLRIRLTERVGRRPGFRAGGRRGRYSLSGRAGTLSVPSPNAQPTYALCRAKTAAGSSALDVAVKNGTSSRPHAAAAAARRARCFIAGILTARGVLNLPEKLQPWRFLTGSG